jgi:anti-sigma factor RsiW
MDELEVAAYLDRRMPDEERRRMDAHLAACSDCRAEVVDVELFRRRFRRPRRLAMAATLALATAAGIVLMVMPRLGSEGKATLRDSGTDNRLVVYGPLGEISSDSIRFVWGAIPHATTYRLTVSTGGGRVVWSASVADTVATLPDSVVLRRGDQYGWVVDALLGDGTTRSTGLREFHPQ